MVQFDLTHQLHTYSKDSHYDFDEGTSFITLLKAFETAMDIDAWILDYETSMRKKSRQRE